jgi:hypothetical protein
MSISGPPTDNLYKFLAITGVLLAIIPAQFAFQRGVELSIQLEQSQGRVKALEISVNGLLEKSKDLEGYRKQLDNAITTLERDSLERVESQDKLSDRVKRLDARREKLGESTQSMQKILESTRIDRESLNSEVKIMRIMLLALCVYYVMAVICLAVGLRLSFLGFSRWYELYQRPLDIAAERELDRLLLDDAGSARVNSGRKKQPWWLRFLR